MSMKLYSEVEFFAELKKHGLTPTNAKTQRSQVWRDQNNEPIFVPYGLPSYPGYILDELLCALGKLYTDSSPIDEKIYSVTSPKVLHMKREEK